MISPCPRCGATRTDSVRHGAMYKLVWTVGYRLQRCSRCRLPRFIRRHRDESPDSLQLGEEAAAGPHFTDKGRAREMAKENSEPTENQVTSADSSNRGWGRCPACGSTAYHHRSRRTTLERILLRPRMARCEKCGSRFPYPKHVEESPDSLQLGEEAAAGLHFAEERRAQEIAKENSERTENQVTGADSSNRARDCCPACGSTAYRRSRRTTLERILLRPRMARCRKCRRRFPYPKR